MKLYLFIGCLVLLSATPKKYPIKIEITYTSSYCGGAAPNEEMLNSIAMPRPLPFKKLYLKKGEVNSFENKLFKVLIADSNGLIKVSLVSGNYFIVDENKKDKTVFDAMVKKYANQTKTEGPIDIECYKKWFSTPDIKIIVSNKLKQEFQLNINNDCFFQGKPCIPYFGPMPP